MSEERGVTYDYFLDYTKMEVNDFMNNLDSLIDNGLIHRMDNNKLTLSPKGKTLLDEKKCHPTNRVIFINNEEGV